MEQEEFRKESAGAPRPLASQGRPSSVNMGGRPPQGEARPPRPNQPPQGTPRPPRPPKHYHTTDTPGPSRPPHYSYQLPQVGTIIHPIPQVQQIGRAAYIRFFNAIIGEGAVDAYLDGTLVAQSLEYGRASNYATVTSNIDLNHTVVVYQAGRRGNPILEARIPLNRGSVYTGALGGSLPSVGLQSVAIQRMEIPTQMAIFRFDHLSPNNTALDVKLNGQKVFGCVAFWNVTRPIGLYTGAYTIELLPCGSQTPIYTMSSVNIGVGAYTLYGIGLLDGQPPFQGILLKD